MESNVWCAGRTPLVLSPKPACCARPNAVACSWRVPKKCRFALHQLLIFIRMDFAPVWHTRMGDAVASDVELGLAHGLFPFALCAARQASPAFRGFTRQFSRRFDDEWMRQPQTTQDIYANERVYRSNGYVLHARSTFAA
jgi:hypothetical protein